MGVARTRSCGRRACPSLHGQLDAVPLATLAYLAPVPLIGCRPVKVFVPGWRRTAVTVLQMSQTVFTDQPSIGRKAFLRTCMQTGAGAEAATTAAGFGVALTGRARATAGVARSTKTRAWRSIAETSRKLRWNNAPQRACCLATARKKANSIDDSRQRNGRAIKLLRRRTLTRNPGHETGMPRLSGR